MQQSMAQLMTDPNRIKYVLVGNNLQELEEIFEPKRRDTIDDFEDFAERLSNDQQQKDWFVSIPLLRPLHKM